MENNIQRYKGNENQINYYTQQPFGQMLGQHEYIQDEYQYQSISNMGYQNFTHQYRHQNAVQYDHHAMYNDYNFDHQMSNYMYGIQNMIPPYQDNFHNMMEQMSYENQYYTEVNSNRPAYSQFSSPVRNFNNYRQVEHSPGDFYQEINYQNIGGNLQGFNPATGMPNLPDIPSYFQPQSTQNMSHSHFCGNQARPTFINNRMESPQTYRQGESLRDTVLNSNKTKQSLGLPYSSAVSKTFEAKDVPLMSGMNFKVSHSAATATNPAGSQSVSSFEDIQVNSKDFPSLCDGQKTSSSNAAYKNSQIKPQNSEEPLGKRRTISSSQGVPIKHKISTSLPDVSQFLASYTPISIPQTLSVGLLDLSKSLSKVIVVGCDLVGKSDTTNNSQGNPEKKNMKSTEQDYPVPYDYIIYQSIRDKVAKVDCKLFNDDTLFFIYYNEDDDNIKLSAIAYLYARKWKYHMGNNIWVKIPPSFASGDNYNYFDPIRWECVTTDRFLDPKLFEENVYQRYLNYEASVVTVQNNLLNTCTSTTQNMECTSNSILANQT